MKTQRLLQKTGQTQTRGEQSVLLGESRPALGQEARPHPCKNILTQVCSNIHTESTLKSPEA